MKTDSELKTFVSHLQKLRAYDDDLSNVIRIKMIEELTMQIRTNIIHKNKLVQLR